MPCNVSSLLIREPAARRQPSGWCLLAGLFCLLAGCVAGLDPAPDNSRFYLLTAPEGQMPEMARDSAGSLRLGLKKIELPGYLRHRKIAVRKGPHEIRYEENHRWGERPEHMAARVLAESLAAAPGIRSAAVPPWPGAGGYDYWLRVRFIRFEGGDNGQVKVQAQWEIIHPGNNAVLREGQTKAPDAEWNGRDFRQLARALSGGLQQVASDIQAALAARP